MGSTQSTPSPPPPPTNSPRKCDVFINCYSKDTKDTITSHLCEALCHKKIQTFIHDENENENRIKAMEESKISIVVFSKGFASSKWCLRQLVEIMKYKKIVLPVFYNIEATHVRNQSGSFESDFVKYEKEWREEVEIWRQALFEASNLSGWDSSTVGPESKLVEKIVEDVLKKLNITALLSNSTNFVGIDSRVEWVKSLLCIGSLDFKVVGIWGMGGVGKTTLASLVFDQISHQFESSCFIANVREESQNLGGLTHLRDQILSKILDEKISLGTPNMPTLIKRRLEGKRILIVLDDVTNMTQLEALSGGLKRFGPGSRIIVTTRDKHLLINYGVKDSMFRVDPLCNEDALRLFCRYAFKEDQPPEDFKSETERAAKFAGGNPLALKVLGSHLFRRSREEWGSALRKLRKISNPEIHNILRISFDGLDKEEQEIFLDIACFFKREPMDYVLRILNGCYFSAQYGISVLLDRSLLTIYSRSRKVGMHDLIQEMGWEIVRGNSFSRPWMHNRLHDQEDISLVLKKNLGTEAVQGMFLDLCKVENLDLDSKAFEKMYNIRYLKFYDKENYHTNSQGGTYTSKVQLPQDLLYLPEQLRYFHWNGYPSKSLPTNFNPENLIELDLSASHIQQLWKGKKHIPKLKRLTLYDSTYLTELPDVSDNSSLEVIDLSFCKNLVDVSSSIQNLENLQHLYLYKCENLRTFSNNVHFESLKSLNLADCTNLQDFPPLSGNIKLLMLTNTAIEEVPSSITNLTGLVQLNISHCASLRYISSEIFKLKSLERLSLYDCSNFENFPEILKTMEKLEELELSGTGITTLPSSIEKLIGLQRVQLKRCRNLKTLPVNFCNLKRLESLEILECSNLTELPENFGNLSALTYLNANRAALTEIPSSMMDLINLRELSASECTGLRFPILSSSLSSLTRMYLNDCHLQEIAECIGCLPSLVNLELCGNKFVTLPKSIKNLPELRELWLNNCDMLTSLPELPSRLQRLETINCKELQWLPNESHFAELIIQRWINRECLYEEANYIFTNCLKLDERLFSEALERSLRVHQMVTTPGAEEDRVRTPVSIWFPGNQIPNWFTHKTVGSSIEVQLSPTQHNGKLLGFALCVLIEFEKSSDYSSLYSIQYEYQYETNSCQNVTIGASLEIRALMGQYDIKNLSIDSDHVALGYRDCSELIQDWNDYSAFTFRFFLYDGNCRVKCCGVYPVYAMPNRIDPSNIGYSLQGISTSGGGYGRWEIKEIINPGTGIVKYRICLFLLCFSIFVVGFCCGAYILKSHWSS